MFLLKYGKALRFSKVNLDFVNKKKDELNKKNIEIKNKFKEVAKLVQNKTFIFSKESKENGELYGSIKPKEISTTIENLDKIEIKPSQLDLNKAINKVGSYDVKINLHAEVQAIIHIEVAKQEEVN